MHLRGVAFAQKHRVIAPDNPLTPHDALELDERLDAHIDIWHPGLHIAPARGDGVEKIRVKAVRDLVQARQDRRVVLRAEHDAVHHRRIEFVARDLLWEARVSHQHISLGKPSEQPVRVILRGIRPPACVDDHVRSPPVTVPVPYAPSCRKKMRQLSRPSGMSTMQKMHITSRYQQKRHREQFAQYANYPILPGILHLPSRRPLHIPRQV